MSNNSENSSMTRDDALEALLSQAPPRALPAADAEIRARTAVRAEWQGVVEYRRRRRNAVRYALAAGVVLVAFLSFNIFRTTGMAPVAVADIDKSFGPIYLLGERSELQETHDLQTIVAGQTVATLADSGIGMTTVTGASLRVDQHTRIEFIEPARVHLHSGRIYIDADQADLAIVTEMGEVRHIGTQYMTAVDGMELSVSVRQGQVEIDGSYHDARVSPGQQVTMRGSQRPRTVNIVSYGEPWDWTEAIAPSADFDGRSVLEFLQWVSRETGLGLEFETAAAEALAREKTLHGKVDSPPAHALRIRMMTVDLEWKIENGVIYVRETGN